ncbi:MAG: hypothetical protein NC411_10895 [Bacteroides sp.]|nr:hypothetical protein [Bacteroides sp.]
MIVLAVLLIRPIHSCADTIGGRDTIESYLIDLEENPNDKNLLKTVAFYYMNLYDTQKAIEYGRRLLAIGEKTGDRDFAELYGKIVIASSLIDENPDETFRLLEEARLIAESTANHDALLSINNSLGMYYLFVHNDNYTAATYYYKSLEDAKAINDRRRYGIVLSNLASVYLTMNDLSGCKLAEQAHEIAVGRGEPIPFIMPNVLLPSSIC